MDNRVEFVVAAHNAETSIERCVNSLLAQNLTWRVTVVNDASRDGTGAILARLVDPRLRVVTVSFRSRAKASNLGFARCEAAYVCSVDADVVYIKDLFDRLLPQLERFPFLMLTDVPSDGELREVVLGPDFVPPRNSFLFSRKKLPTLSFATIYPKAGGEDTDLAIRLLKSGTRIGAVYGGYVHERAEGRMGLRRRIHFHLWNLITYLRHLDVPMCRQRLADIARHPLRRVVGSLRQEYRRSSP